MPRKPKTSPSVEPEAQQGQGLGHEAASAAQQPDSHAAPQEPTGADSQHETAATAGRIDAGNADSNVAIAPNEQDTSNAGQAQPTSQQDAGNVPNPPASSDISTPYARVRERLMKHAEWGQIIGTVKEMRLDPKLAKMRAEHRERFIWGEMDRLYPAKQAENDTHDAFGTPETTRLQGETTLGRKGEDHQVARGLGDRISGLGDIPPAWPPLPGNAALAVEVGWVQANRLYVVEELASGGTRVHLDRAHEPAPSRSAIGWLETSIRSYAKFVEVAAKASTGGDEDGEQVKRERMAIDEIRGLLAEMAGNPTGPGR